MRPSLMASAASAHVARCRGIVQGGQVGADPDSVPGHPCRHRLLFAVEWLSSRRSLILKRMSMQSRYRFTCRVAARRLASQRGDLGRSRRRHRRRAADDVVTTARLINGAAIPGMPNVHSHAFQRAMAGLAEQRSGNDDSFWTWRETMYELASRMTPECLNAIAAQLYADMLKAGYTRSASFTICTVRRDGTALREQRLAMCQALIDAADDRRHRPHVAADAVSDLRLRRRAADRAPAAVHAGDATSICDLRRRLRQSLATLAATRDRHRVAQPARRAAGRRCKTVLDVAARRAGDSHSHRRAGARGAGCQQHSAQRPIEWLLEHAPRRSTLVPGARDSCDDRRSCTASPRPAR